LFSSQRVHADIAKCTNLKHLSLCALPESHLRCTRTHTHTHTHRHKHTHTHTHRHKHPYAYPNTHPHTRMRARTRARSYCNELKTIPPLNPLVSLSVLGLYNNLLSSAELAGAPPCLPQRHGGHRQGRGVSWYDGIRRCLTTYGGGGGGVSGNSR
jgi:hypothetical protein